MKVQTKSVRNRVVGDARKALKAAAGANQILSKAEAKKLKKDVAAAAETVRAKKGRVTVNDAVDAYASKVSRVLSAVDTRRKGSLSEAEANAIRDPALRSSVREARQKLIDGGPTATGGARPAAAAILAALRDPMGPLEAYHESGDHGVNVTARKVPGQTLTAALAAVTLDPAAPWTHGEHDLQLQPAAGVTATITRFLADAKADLEAERDDMPDVIESFCDAVKAQFGALTDVRLARGKDLGGAYLIGKTADGYVAIAAQRYQD
jgi:hypothetical protein